MLPSAKKPLRRAFYPKNSPSEPPKYGKITKKVKIWKRKHLVICGIQKREYDCLRKK
jgi:hypothetical protein